MFENTRRKLARLIAPARKHQRQYAAARQSRLTSDWQSPNNSSDSELVSSLQLLRSRSRQLIRDNSYAKRAKVIVQNNVIGSGIYMEPKVRKPRGSLDERVNGEIEEAWSEWCRAENCHTGGKLHFADLERQAVGQIFEAGEVLIRKHYQKFGDSAVPFGLELVEAERLADEFTTPVQDLAGMYRMGIERDEFGRPVGFWLRKYHPGELRYATGDPNMLERVAADKMFHLYVCDRWPQTRGEPWLHTAARRLNDMDGYSEAEIVAARGAASYMGTIESPDGEGMNDQSDPNAQSQFDLEPGAVQHLLPGEKFELHSPNRPNPNMDPFMRLMLREVAAGAGVSYESLSRDYSQSNYSSSRLALLDDRDLWKVIQQFFIRSFREPLHREWLQQAVLSRRIQSVSVSEYQLNKAKFEAVSFKPRGWSWIDPTKEVEAYKAARRAGFMSTAQIVAQTGGGVDLGDVWDEIEAENADAKAKGLILDTDPALVNDKGQTQPAPALTDPAPAAATAAPGETEARGFTRSLFDSVESLRTEIRGVADRQRVSPIPITIKQEPTVVNVNQEPIRVEIKSDPVQVSVNQEPITIKLEQEPLTVRSEIHHDPIMVEIKQPAPQTVTKVVTLNPPGPDGARTGTVTETQEAA